MSDTKAPIETYKASCHCGAFAYTVKTASLAHESTEVVRCNCSICLRNGIYNIYVPDDDITFTTGQFADLQSYTFATHSVAYRFCPTCGSSCLARSIRPGFFDGVSIINVRMFEGVEVEGLRFKEMDGRSYTKEKAEARVTEIEAAKAKAAAESGV